MQLISILGPTASGKSAVALAAARRVGGELVSCDSMQVYRGLDIGTAKPSLAERREIPHHLIDTRDLAEPGDVRTWRDEAEACIRAILSRGRQPILCGGTGLYAKVLLYGYALRPRDPAVAAALATALAAGQRAELLAELARVDPVAAARGQANDRRLLRALEVVRLTGQPLAAPQAPRPDYAGPEWVLMPAPELLRRRIAERCRQMLAQGWIEETAALLALGLRQAPTASQALGYPVVADFVEGKIASREELATRIIALTWQYARRQRTWFRHQHPAAQILPIESDADLAAAAERVVQGRPG